MFSKLYKNSSVKNILVITLSNIGDAVLTAPVIDILLRDFPSAHLTLVIGPKAKTLFSDHPRVEMIIYDKRMPWPQQIKWFLALRKIFFDVIIDLRQSALGVFLAGRWRTPLNPTVSNSSHMQIKHMDRLREVYQDFVLPFQRLSIIPKSFEKASDLKRYVVIAPGAADSAKRWLPSGFVKVADGLVERGLQVVFVGDNQDASIVQSIQAQMKHQSLSLAGSIDLRQLAFVLEGAQFAITHDSGVMHLASYFDLPLVVLWGPTDISKYGPWSTKHEIVINRLACPRCRNLKIDVPHECMSAITVEDVLNAIKHIQ